MLRLTYSNRTEALFERFAADLAAFRADRGLFEPALLVVPNRNVEIWLKRQLARRDGIAANFEVLQLRRFVSGLLGRHDPELRLVDFELLQDLVLSVLLDDARLASSGLAPVRAWLEGGGEAADAVDLRRVQLASQLARLFEEYGFSRPDMLEAWPRRVTLTGRWAGTEAWQRALWLEIFGRGGLLERRAQATGERHRTLPQVVAELPADALGGGRPVFLFGVSYVATIFKQVLARIAGAGELNVYTLNPCMEFWEDLPTGREQARRERLPHRGAHVDPATLDQEDPFGLKASWETPALALWGRPGRENVRLLDQLSQCDFTAAFEDPLDSGAPTLLKQLQRDILVREPERAAPDPAFAFQGDQSVRLLACPGVRREAEAIASEIWALIREDEARAAPDRLRFSDIAVLVAGKSPEGYFTHLASAFEERGFDIPFTLEATALAIQSRVGEAARLLVALPFGRFTRAEVLRLLTHPAVAARFPDADPQEWARWCDELGIFHGIDHQDHEGSYLERDLHSWDQGLRRLALGAVMTGLKSNDARAFELGAERYLPEEHTESAEGSAQAFGRLARSLLADARFARAQRLTMEEWADLFGRLLETYLVPRSEGERVDLERCAAAVRGLSDLRLEGRKVGYRIAGELAQRSLEGLTRSHGRKPDEGVALSTLQPMRALPFKAIFVAGLGEGRFPSADRPSELDLRGAKARPGDVSAREQDQYMFLETLLCARQRLYLSWQARDELTGEELPPSPVVVELTRMLERGYLKGAGEALRRDVPLRRFAAAPEGTVAPPGPPEAQVEAQLLLLRKAMEDALGVRRLQPAELRERLPKPVADIVEARLRLSKPPRAARVLAPGPLRVRLADLRRFLECPLQGSARFLLRLEEDEEDRSLVEDEPFEGGRLEHLAGERFVFLEWLRERGKVELAQLAQRWAEPLIAAGRLPAGFLFDLEKGALLRGPAAWRQLIEETEHLINVKVHRFGPASELARVDLKHDPITLNLEGSEGCPEGLKVEIVGTTGAVLEDGAGELGLWQRARSYGWSEEARLQHDSLGAFLDHVAFSAAGLRRDGFSSIQLYDHSGKNAKVPYQFAPIARERALGYLRSLVGELLVVREELMPAVAVFGWASARRKGLSWTFAGVVDDLKEGKGFLASNYGPVRDAASYPAPSDEVAQQLIERRFGLWFDCANDEGARGLDTAAPRRG